MTSFESLRIFHLKCSRICVWHEPLITEFWNLLLYPERLTSIWCNWNLLFLLLATLIFTCLYYQLLGNDSYMLFVYNHLHVCNVVYFVSFTLRPYGIWLKLFPQGSRPFNMFNVTLFWNTLWWWIRPLVDTYPHNQYAMSKHTRMN